MQEQQKRRDGSYRDEVRCSQILKRKLEDAVFAKLQNLGGYISKQAEAVWRKSSTPLRSRLSAAAGLQVVGAAAATAASTASACGTAIRLGVRCIVEGRAVHWRKYDVSGALRVFVFLGELREYFIERFQVRIPFIFSRTPTEEWHSSRGCLRSCLVSAGRIRLQVGHVGAVNAFICDVVSTAAVIAPLNIS